MSDPVCSIQQHSPVEYSYLFFVYTQAEKEKEQNISLFENSIKNVVDEKVSLLFFVKS